MRNSKSSGDEKFVKRDCAKRSRSAGSKCSSDYVDSSAGGMKQLAPSESEFLTHSFHKNLIPAGFGRCISAIILASMLTATSAASLAQTKKKPPRKGQSSLNERVAKAKDDVIAAANDYKASLEKLLAFQENDVKSAADTVEKRKALLTQNIISKKEVEESEQALTAAQVKVNVTKGQIAEADSLIAEAKGEAQLARLGPSRAGAYQTTAALIRYNGPASWVLTDAAKVESFFASKFHHALPISAFGQTAVHDHLGFDHHNSMDVALSPDSAEGQALMAYLRSAGIPFIAFRYAVPGSATGAHIHVGYPSRRIGK